MNVRPSRKSLLDRGCWNSPPRLVVTVPEAEDPAASERFGPQSSDEDAGGPLEGPSLDLGPPRYSYRDEKPFPLTVVINPREGWEGDLSANKRKETICEIAEWEKYWKDKEDEPI